ncbi:hypothetical protein BFS14_03695 [Serratia fonticola]|uniref:hypothetical protein n=1 Tax=Serratia fonticola TaxID=47917 RepID=UPI0008FD6BB6|nr:hypothetical protein [Serratia fonticola]MBC3249405.1 hypothetical protein [Serratia fonticola]OIX92746.1 hypothetical protein BFS14_03695 [Serratia fonticola]QCR60232.1 hypothetical protein FD644_07625 [Serratia fonticola]
MINFDSILNEYAHKPVVMGEWFAIQWNPDVATGERLNIGVCFRDNSGASFVQTLEYFERIACLYSLGMVFHLKLACELAKEVVLSGGEFNANPCGNISFSSKGYAQGDSVDEIMSSLFANVVPLAVKVVKKKEKVFSPVSRDRLYNIMDGYLKQRLEYEEYFQMRDPSPLKRVTLGNQTQSIYLPYKSNHSLGTLASAAYADENLAKCHLYDAQRDISLALNSYSEFKNGAIFILSPNNDLKIDKRDQVDLEIDKFCWYLKTQAIETEVDSDPDSLSDRAIQWYRRHAA